jgi:hypothetical protein
LSYNDPFNIYTRFIPMTLNRKQIKEALETTPIDKLILGGNAKDISLTHKQKAFCEAIAKGEPKAKAYREAYDSKSSSHTQSKEGTKLMQDPRITSHIEALRLAIESQKYLFPSHLRALVIQQLTEKALDPSVNHAQQIKALELIGKFSDVNLFQERKEIKSNENTTDAKTKLLETLSNAIGNSSKIDQDKKKRASQLLQEIAQSMNPKSEPITIDQAQDDDQLSQESVQSIGETDTNHLPKSHDPTPAGPPKNFEIEGLAMHTIPDKQSPSETTPIISDTEKGEGVSNFWEQFEELPQEKTPLLKKGPI